MARPGKYAENVCKVYNCIYVTKQPRVSDWVVQIHLWPSGLGIGLWSEWPRVWSLHGPLHWWQRYSRFSCEWKLPALVEIGPSQGARISIRGSNVMNQPSISDWVVQVPLWPSGLGVGRSDPGSIPARSVTYMKEDIQLGSGLLLLHCDPAVIYHTAYRVGMQVELGR